MWCALGFETYRFHPQILVLYVVFVLVLCSILMQCTYILRTMFTFKHIRQMRQAIFLRLKLNIILLTKRYDIMFTIIVHIQVDTKHKFCCFIKIPNVHSTYQTNFKFLKKNLAKKDSTFTDTDNNVAICSSFLYVPIYQVEKMAQKQYRGDENAMHMSSQCSFILMVSQMINKALKWEWSIYYSPMKLL